MHNLANSYSYVLAPFLPSTGFEEKNRLVSLFFSPQKKISSIFREKGRRKKKAFSEETIKAGKFLSISSPPNPASRAISPEKDGRIEKTYEAKQAGDRKFSSLPLSQNSFQIRPLKMDPRAPWIEASEGRVFSSFFCLRHSVSGFFIFVYTEGGKDLICNCSNDRLALVAPPSFFLFARSVLVIDRGRREAFSQLENGCAPAPSCVISDTHSKRFVQDPLLPRKKNCVKLREECHF